MGLIVEGSHQYFVIVRIIRKRIISKLLGIIIIFNKMKIQVIKYSLIIIAIMNKININKFHSIFKI